MTLDLDAIEARQRAAHRMVRDLDAGRRQWTLSVPAEPNYDPDLVIDAALRDIPALIAELRAARAVVEAAVIVIEETMSERQGPYTYDPTMWTVQRLGAALTTYRAVMEHTQEA